MYHRIKNHWQEVFGNVPSFFIFVNVPLDKKHCQELFGNVTSYFHSLPINYLNTVKLKLFQLVKAHISPIKKPIEAMKFHVKFQSYSEIINISFVWIYNIIMALSISKKSLLDHHCFYILLKRIDRNRMLQEKRMVLF